MTFMYQVALVSACMRLLQQPMQIQDLCLPFAAPLIDMSSDDSVPVDPVEEWHDPPTMQQHDTVAPVYGKWYWRTQELAKAILDGNEDLAVQLARLCWAGDPEVAGLR